MLELVETLLPAGDEDIGNGAGGEPICPSLKGRGCRGLGWFRVGFDGVWFLFATGCFLDGSFILSITSGLEAGLGFLPLVE